MASAEVEINDELSDIKIEYENLRSQLCKLENLLCKENGGELGLSARLQLQSTKLFNTEQFSDVQVILKGGSHIKAHKMILAASGNDWGVEQFDHVDMLDLTDLRYEVGYALMQWVYTDDFGGYSDYLDDNFFIEMMQAAKVCKLKSLHIRCQKALATMVNNETCDKYLKLSEEFDAKILKDNCEKVLAKKRDACTEDKKKVDCSVGGNYKTFVVDGTGQLIPLKMCLNHPEPPKKDVAGVTRYDTPSLCPQDPELVTIVNDDLNEIMNQKIIKINSNGKIIILNPVIKNTTHPPSCASSAIKPRDFKASDNPTPVLVANPTSAQTIWPVISPMDVKPRIIDVRTVTDPQFEKMDTIHSRSTNTNSSTTFNLSEQNPTSASIPKSQTISKQKPIVNLKGIQNPTSAYSVLKNCPLLANQDGQTKPPAPALVIESVQKTSESATCSPSPTLTSVIQETTSFNVDQASKGPGTQTRLLTLDNQPMKTSQTYSKEPACNSLPKTNPAVGAPASSPNKKQTSVKCKSRPVITVVYPHTLPGSSKTFYELLKKLSPLTSTTPKEGDKQHPISPANNPEDPQSSLQTPILQSSTKPASRTISVPKPPYKCKICGIKFSTCEALDQHLKDPKNSHFECPECRKCCSAQIGFCVHCYASSQRSKFKDTAAKDTKVKIKCTICEKMIVSKRFIPHMRTHTGEKPDKNKPRSSRSRKKGGKQPPTPPEDPQSSSQTPILQSSIKPASRSKSVPKWLYKCPICDQRFCLRVALNQHLKNPKNSHFECPKCGKCCNAQLGFCIHCYVSSERKKNKNTDIKYAKVQIKCSICEKVVNYHGFTAHMKTHTGEKPYKCVMCNKLFSTFKTLKNHKKLYNTNHSMCSGCNYFLFEDEQKDHVCGTRQYRPPSQWPRRAARKHAVCEFCGKNYLKEYLKYHIEHVHQKIKPYQCDVCGKSVKNNYILKSHMRTHTGHVEGDTKSANRHQCTVCNKSFISSHIYNDHMKRHNGIKDIPCKECDKMFYSAGLRNQHYKIFHLGNTKQYPCRFCDKSFPGASQRSGHYAKYHKDVYTPKFIDNKRLKRVIPSKNTMEQATPADKPIQQAVPDDNATKQKTPLDNVTEQAIQDISAKQNTLYNGMEQL